MKKIMTLMLAVMIMATLAGCSKSDPEPAVTPTPLSAEDTDKKVDESDSAKVTEQLITATPDPTDVPVKENTGDFSTSTGSFFWDQSSELNNCTMFIFPIDDKKAVIQLDYLKAEEGEEISEETVCSLTYELIDKTTYKNDESGITMTIDDEGNVTVATEKDAYSKFNGNYLSNDGIGWVADDTILEFLRNIPEAELGDFKKGSNTDEVVENYVEDWFHELTLYRDGNLYGTYVATDDMSALCKVQDDNCKLLYGSMDSTLEQTQYYSFDGGDENGEETYYFEEPLIYPYVTCGSDLPVGMSVAIDVKATYDMTENYNVTYDAEILEYDGENFTAIAPGETTIEVELTYGGSTKLYTIELNVIEDDPETSSESDMYIDPNHLYFLDTQNYGYSMEITIDDGFYNVDITSTVAPDTYRHWSYFGEELEDDPDIVYMTGSRSLETYDEEGNCSEEIEAEGLIGGLVKDYDGYYHWLESYEDEDETAKFELINKSSDNDPDDENEDTDGDANKDGILDDGEETILAQYGTYSYRPDGMLPHFDELVIDDIYPDEDTALAMRQKLAEEYDAYRDENGYSDWGDIEPESFGTPDGLWGIYCKSDEDTEYYYNDQPLEGVEDWLVLFKGGTWAIYDNGFENIIDCGILAQPEDSYHVFSLNKEGELVSFLDFDTGIISCDYGSYHRVYELWE